MTPPISRILDANFNRAREALRVMEDYARFVLEDPAGSEVLKRCRHDLSACMRRLGGEELVSARDTPGDVGTGLSTPSEAARGDARAVFVAAAKRLPEALRTIEEYAKTVDGDAAAAAEQLRYRAYELEQRVLLRGERSARFSRVRLYVIVTASLCRGDWLATAERAIEGGAECIQLREKDLEDGELLARARRLGALCLERGVLFVMNDRADIARLCDADGVHLGQTDVSPADARRIVGPDRLIGLSTHTPEQLRAAIAAGADYIAVGPMFASTTKPQPHVAGPELLRLAGAETGIPVVPIGGIGGENVDILKASGATRVCVCSAVIGAEDVTAAAREIRGLLAPARSRDGIPA
jgi:thiamine-phosphate pyrophosphorylase